MTRPRVRPLFRGKGSTRELLQEHALQIQKPPPDRMTGERWADVRCPRCQRKTRTSWNAADTTSCAACGAHTSMDAYGIGRRMLWAKRRENASRGNA